MRPKISFEVNKGHFKKDLVNSMSRLNDPNTFKRELVAANGKNLFKLYIFLIKMISCRQILSLIYA